MSSRFMGVQTAEMPMVGSLIRLNRGLRDLMSLIHEDWVTNYRDWTLPGFRAIAVHRIGTWLSDRRASLLKSCFLTLYRLMYRYVRNHYGIEIPLPVTLGRRLFLAHQHGIVFHWKTVIGDDCLIRHSATIGAGYGGEKTLHKGPRIGNHVEIGPGAVIFAGVKIGDGAIIGPNTVVMADVPSGARIFAEAPRVIQLPSAQSKDRDENKL